MYVNPGLLDATDGSPVVLIVLPVASVVTELVDWQQRTFVFVIFESCVVGTVNAEVYTAVPFTRRTLEISPGKNCDGVEFALEAILNPSPF